MAGKKTSRVDEPKYHHGDLRRAIVESALQTIEESGIRGIASRHGYKVEKLAVNLYDLSKDPGESKNVAGDHPDIVRKLQTLAEEYRKDLGDSLTKVVGTGLRPVGRE